MAGFMTKTVDFCCRSAFCDSDTFSKRPICVTLKSQNNGMLRAHGIYNGDGTVAIPKKQTAHPVLNMANGSYYYPPDEETITAVLENLVDKVHENAIMAFDPECYDCMRLQWGVAFDLPAVETLLTFKQWKEERQKTREEQRRAQKERRDKRREREERRERDERKERKRCRSDDSSSSDEDEWRCRRGEKCRCVDYYDYYLSRCY